MEIEFFVNENTIVKPGQNICKNTPTIIIGAGLFQEADYIKSSKLGKIEITNTQDGIQLMIRGLKLKRDHIEKTNKLNIGDSIIGRVIKINEFWAKIMLISINNNPVSHDYLATIKRENMRNIDIDSIEVEHLLSPNDIIIAKIKSLNESKNILLSIEDSFLGVLFSYSENKNQLIPISKERMQSPISKKEYRKKVACLEK